jgi:hypothetical protein
MAKAEQVIKMENLEVHQVTELEVMEAAEMAKIVFYRFGLPAAYV